MQNATTVNAAPVADLPASTPSATRWRTEDWIAVVLGFVVIAAVLVAVPVEGVRPAQRRADLPLDHRQQIASLTPGWIASLDAIAADADAKGQQNVVAAEPGPQGCARQPATARRSRPRPASWQRSAAQDRGRRARRRRSADMPRRPPRAACSRATTSPRCSTSASAFSSSPAIGIALLGGRVLPFLIGLPVVFGLALARAPARRQRTVRRLGHRVRDLRARCSGS